EVRRQRSQWTANSYIQAIKGFTRWLWRDKRAREHHLMDLKTKDAKSDRRHIRRLLSADEARTLIEMTERSKRNNSGFTGPDRAMLYRLALGSGFRAKELRTLVPERFNLSANPPTVTVLACFSKNREEAVQPIAQSLADQLRPWLAAKTPGRPVFAGMNARTA